MQSGGFGDHAPPPGTGACSRTSSLGAGRGPRGALASTEAGTLSRKAVCRRAREDRQRPRLSAEIAVDDPMSRKWPCVCRRGLSHKVHVFRNTDNIVFFRWKCVTWVHGEISQTLPQDQAGLVTRHAGPLLRHPRPAVLGISVGPYAPPVGSTPCGEHPRVGSGHVPPIAAPPDVTERFLEVLSVAVTVHVIAVRVCLLSESSP